MLTVVTYLENAIKLELGEQWAVFDRYIHDNLEYALGVDRHYYVALGSKELKWFYELPKGLGDIRCVVSLKDAVNRHPDADFVNVQPPSVFEKAGEDFEWLHDFRHPDNACYIFGPNHGAIELVKGANVSIQIKESALYASSATAMVLYDRRAKIETGFGSRPSTERNERYRAASS